MAEVMTEKIITTELRPFLRAEGWNFYMALKCTSNENADIFNVIDQMKFKLVIAYRDDEYDGYSEMVELFETTEWVYIEIDTEEKNRLNSSNGNLDVYELIDDGGYFNTKLYQCLSDILPKSDENYEEEDEEYDSQIMELNQEFIDNMTSDGDLNQLMEIGIAQYIKTYF